MDSDSKYIQLLVAIPVAAVLADMLLDMAGLGAARRLLIWVGFSAALYFLLALRTQYLRVSRGWALTAVVPGLGLLVGIVFYFQSPKPSAGA